MTDHDNNKFEGLRENDLTQVNGGDAFENLQRMDWFANYLKAGDKDAARKFYELCRQNGELTYEDAEFYRWLYFQYTGEELLERVL